jgi:hypothetical protein
MHSRRTSHQQSGADAQGNEHDLSESHLTPLAGTSPTPHRVPCGGDPQETIRSSGSIFFESKTRSSYAVSDAHDPTDFHLDKLEDNMLPFLALQAIAAPRGEGLRPELLEKLRCVAGNPEFDLPSTKSG